VNADIFLRLSEVTRQLIVRELDASFASRAGELLRQAYQQIYPNGTGDGYLDRVAEVGERLTKATVLGCFLDLELTGCTTFVLDHNSEFAEGLIEGEAGLRMLGVDPKFQRLGVARMLVGECLRRAAENDRRALLLHTDKKMIAAQNLYEHMAFSRVPDRDLTFPEVELLCYRRVLVD
jgi:ribosomal protein S18 acetylase RimI-like enzyme